MKKYLTAFAILILCVFSFFGCAKVEFLRTIDGNNAIMDRLVIELNKEKVESTGKTLGEVISTIESDFQIFRNHVFEWKKQFNYEDYPTLKDRVDKGIDCIVEKVGSRLTLTVSYEDYTMFGLFYGITNIDGHEYEKAMTDVGPFLSSMLTEDGEKENMGLLLYKYALIKDSGLINNLEALEEQGDNFYKNIYDKYRKLTADKYDVKDLDISQVFVYPDDDIYSNADGNDYYGGLTMLSWDLTDTGSDFIMEVYKVAPRSVNWYVVALIISAIVVVVLFVNFGSKSRNEKMVTKEEVEKDGK